MAHFKLAEDVYFDCDRMTRAAYTGYVYGKNAIASMQAYEDRKKAEARANKNKSKGKRR